jgi:hypothetical protein
MILTAFEGVTLIGSRFALRGFLMGKNLAWMGFAGNFLPSVAAAWFFLMFRLTGCSETRRLVIGNGL